MRIAGATLWTHISKEKASKFGILLNDYQHIWIMDEETKGDHQGVKSVLPYFIILLATSMYFFVILLTSWYFSILLGTSLEFLGLLGTSLYFSVLPGTSLYFSVLLGISRTSWYFSYFSVLHRTS